MTHFPMRHKFPLARLVFIVFPFIVKRNKTKNPTCFSNPVVFVWNCSTESYANRDPPRGRGFLPGAGSRGRARGSGVLAVSSTLVGGGSGLAPRAALPLAHCSPAAPAPSPTLASLPSGNCAHTASSSSPSSLPLALPALLGGRARGLVGLHGAYHMCPHGGLSACPFLGPPAEPVPSLQSTLEGISWMCSGFPHAW